MQNIDIDNMSIWFGILLSFAVPFAFLIRFGKSPEERNAEKLAKNT